MHARKHACSAATSHERAAAHTCSAAGKLDREALLWLEAWAALQEEGGGSNMDRLPDKVLHAHRHAHICMSPCGHMHMCVCVLSV